MNDTAAETQRVPVGSTCGEVATSMDFLPTFARLAGGEPPSDRIIDGKDIRPLLFGEAGARSPHGAFFCCFLDDIDAVRSGKWKLFVGRTNRKERRRDEIRELYDLGNDIAETTNVAEKHPDVVRELAAKVDACRADIDDAWRGVEGATCRPVGRVENPAPLTMYDPDHPYIEAMYDVKDAG